MKILRSIALLAVCSTVSFGQTGNVAVTLNLSFSGTILADVNTFWSHQHQTAAGTVINSIGANDTSFTMSANAGAAAITTGQTLIIESGTATEAVSVSGVTVSGATTTVTITRNVLPAVGGVTPFGARTHASGVDVYIAAYTSPFTMAADWLRKQMMQISSGLGQDSAVYAATATGTVTAQ